MPTHLQTKLRPFTKPCLESGWVKQDSQARIKDKKQPIPLILKQLILASVVFSFKKKNKSIASRFFMDQNDNNRENLPRTSNVPSWLDKPRRSNRVPIKNPIYEG